MRLVRAEFDRNVSLILGGAFHPMRHFAPAACPTVPYLETPDEDLQVWKPDGGRLTFPATSIASWIRTESAAQSLPIPTTRKWQIEGVYLRGGGVVTCGRCGIQNPVNGSSIHLDQLGQLTTWTREKHGALSNAEVRGRSVWITKPRGDVIQVPFHAIAWILEVPITEPPIVVEDWPATEVTPSAPPRRTPRRS